MTSDESLALINRCFDVFLPALRDPPSDMELSLWLRDFANMNPLWMAVAITEAHLAATGKRCAFIRRVLQVRAEESWRPVGCDGDPLTPEECRQYVDYMVANHIAGHSACCPKLVQPRKDQQVDHREYAR